MTQPLTRTYHMFRGLQLGAEGNIGIFRNDSMATDTTLGTTSDGEPVGQEISEADNERDNAAIGTNSATQTGQFLDSTDTLEGRETPQGVSDGGLKSKRTRTEADGTIEDEMCSWNNWRQLAYL